MADNAFEFAAKNNLLRQNQVHGEQEAKLLLEDGFSLDSVQEEIVEQRQHMEVEESWHKTRSKTKHIGLQNRFLVNRNFNENDLQLRILMEASWTMGFQTPAVNFSSNPMMMTWEPRLPIKQLLIPDLSSVLANYMLTTRESKKQDNFNHVRSYLPDLPFPRT